MFRVTRQCMRPGPLQFLAATEAPQHAHASHAIGHRTIDIEMPVADQVVAVLRGDRSVEDAVGLLMRRPGKSERAGITTVPHVIPTR